MASYSVFFFALKLFPGQRYGKNIEWNYCRKSNTSNGDVNCIAVILFCASLDKTRAHLRILSLKMQTIINVLKVASAIRRRTFLTEDDESRGISIIMSSVVANT